jgi:hypothetical protein
MLGMKLLTLPSDCHSLIYCFLESADERLSFLSLSREIYFKSQSYREMKLRPMASRQYALDQSFREKIHSLVRPGHLHLNLSKSRLNDDTASHLGDVFSLDLSWCPDISDESLCHLGNVHILNLSECPLITDEGVRYLGGVHTLDLSSCFQITDECLAHLTHVQSLNLSSCRRITDAGLCHLQYIQSLNLSSCTRITDAGLLHLQHVRSLNISACTRITDEGVCHLGSSSVHTLNLSSCHRITDQSLPHLAKMTYLRCLYLNFCGRISEDGARHYLRVVQTVILPGGSNMSL